MASKASKAAGPEVTDEANSGPSRFDHMWDTSG